MIVILEPFSNKTQIQNFRIQLTMDYVAYNCNGKIWVFWNHEVNYKVLSQDEQQITCEIQHSQLSHNFFTTFVYAKCKDQLRKPLWEVMLQNYRSVSDNYQCIIGDFIVITSTEKKQGDIPYIMRKSIEFLGVIERCDLLDLGFTGQKFTW